MNHPASIEIESISKTYDGKVTALDKLDLMVNPGERFGLIGPDGAGKTSLLRILVTVLLPDSGNARVAGWDIRRDYRQIRRHVGYMPGRFSLYQDLSLQENLLFFASLFNTRIEDNYELIKDIYEQIEPFRDRRAGKLSGGMKQKLALCCALIHRPKVLFLDEPTTGVDAVSRQEFWDMLLRLQAHGITILVSTPYMDEAARCDRVALLQKGKILSLDPPQDIVSAYSHPLWEVRSGSMYKLIRDLRQFEGTHTAFPFGEFVHLALNKQLPKEQLKAYLTDRGHANIIIQPARPTIEDCFMELMGNEAE